MTDKGGGGYMEKSAKGLTPLRRPKLGKNHKISGMKFKNIYEANKWWNDWKLQLYWHRLEWVDPRSISKRDKPLQKYIRSRIDGPSSRQTGDNDVGDTLVCRSIKRI